MGAEKICFLADRERQNPRYHSGQKTGRHNFHEIVWHGHHYCVSKTIIFFVKQFLQGVANQRAKFSDIAFSSDARQLQMLSFWGLTFMGTLKLTAEQRWLIHWPLMGGLLHLVQRGGDWAGCSPAQSPPRCTKCHSPPIHGQCTNHCNVV